MQLPRMIRVRQRFDRPIVADVFTETTRQLQTLKLAARVRAGQSVAITAGSRGIANIAEITRGIVHHCRELRLEPFIVPAMGSHGGATADGQRQVLAEYGIVEEYVGAPIRSSMDTVVVDTTPQGIPVHFDKLASEADHVIVAGRIKPHTGFVGEIESGLHKMMLIGLGKAVGAGIYHKAIKDFTFLEIIRAVADSVIRKCRVLCGVGIVENAFDETALIAAVAPEDFYEREKALLKQARDWLPRLPFPDVDLLIIDRIGKNISGTGMDTNVVGRKYNDHSATELDEARVRRIFVCSLTEQTHGNACGIGLAEFTTRRCAEQVDSEITRVNCVTAGHPTAAMIPVVYETDREAVEGALSTIGLTPPHQAKVIHIADTLHLETVLVSEAYAGEVPGQARLECLGPPEPMAFDSAGFLVPLS
jgi:antitoxin (DNA-binding transcriptional repressor) of toxin-antitoxin stability system